MELSTLIAVIGLVFLLIFIAFFIVIFVASLRWLKRPRVYYAPIRAEDYMCPRCGSKELEVVGVRTLRCRRCGTAFTLRVGTYEEHWVVWPFFWWFPFPIIIPVPRRE